MDEIRGPTIQIVLHVKEGLGFGFLRSPFIVTGSLNGYMLETDPVVACHAPVFDAELVWEADKRRFRSLRVQNVPIKVEVHTVGTQGRKDKVGYFLLSLLGAQPCPSNKIVDVKHTWHRLLGVKSEGKCCQPQLMMSLSIEDRVNTVTPRNELRMFHSNEVAYPTDIPPANPTSKTILFTMNEYIAESKKTVSNPELVPRLLCDEGLIQVGPGNEMFVLSFVIGGVENLDMLLPDFGASKEAVDCYVTYTVFTHDVQTDRVRSCEASGGGCAGGAGGAGWRALFNQRTCLRLRSSLQHLSEYFADCPHLVTRIHAQERGVGICSMDLRKLIPTEDPEKFVQTFCNTPKGFTIHERCFVLRCDETAGVRDNRRPYVDVEMTLQYLGVAKEKKPLLLTARSATQLESAHKETVSRDEHTLDNRSGSCTQLDTDVGGVAYTNMGVCNTARYKNASGDAVIQTNEIAELIKKMYDTFQQSQEQLLAARIKPTTSDMQVQAEPDQEKGTEEKRTEGKEEKEVENTPREEIEPEPIKLEPSKSDSYIGRNGRELVKSAIPAIERNELMQKYVEELEDWKEKQQELFKYQLKRKEEYHLDMLAGEWSKKQSELETKLSRGIEQCRHLAADLSRATEEFRLKGFRNTDREKKLLEAKKALEAHYTDKYQQLRVGSQQLESDMKHQLKLKDMRIEELEMKVQQLEKQVDVLKNNLKNNEKENESRYSGLTKDQTASLIQELRCLEEKLDSAVQSKAFFKEQWGRAVRELHLSKLRTRRHMLDQLQHDRRQLKQMGLDSIVDDQYSMRQSQVDINKLKDDYYVDLLANTPALEATSMINISGGDGIEMFNDRNNTPKNPVNDKLNELIMQRDQLIQQDNPDETVIKQLNHEIRSMLLNCGT